MHIKYFIILSLVFYYLTSCQNNKKGFIIYKDSSGKVTGVYIPEDKTGEFDIKIESAIDKIVENQISCEGTVFIAPDNIKNIIAPFEGEITKINFHKGSEIKVGSTLGHIENIAFIELQKQYLEARNQYNYYKEEYARQGELTIESATSVKKMQVAQRDFQTAELNYNSTSLQLKTLGINPASLENNNILNFIPIISNYKGKISNILLQEGDFVKKGQLLFEITRSDDLLIKLSIPEYYYKSVRIGQSVDCFIASDSLYPYKAEIHLIDKKIDPITHKFEVEAYFKNNYMAIVNGMSVKAKINNIKDSVCIVRKSSVLNTADGNYIFIKNNGKFIKHPVLMGAASLNTIEILGIPKSLNDSIVVSGLKKLNTLFNNQL